MTNSAAIDDPAALEAAANTILEVCMSHSVPRCLHVVTELGVADALDESPQTAAELAESTGANADALGRALRLLAGYGIFKVENGTYTHTPSSRLLRADHPQSTRQFVRLMGLRMGWQTFENLGHSITTGEPAFEVRRPEGVWPYFVGHPDEGEIFAQAMAGKSQGQIMGILARHDFSGYKTIADIGGSQGHLLAAVLDANPDAKGIVFDLPNVIDQVADKASPRLELRGGDFFKDELPVADAYLLMQVIHDWEDEDSIKILKSIRKSAPAGAKLLLIEALVPEDAKPSWQTMSDIFMMVMVGARERTQPEFEALLSASGFKLDRVTDIGLGTFILEASAV